MHLRERERGVGRERVAQTRREREGESCTNSKREGGRERELSNLGERGRERGIFGVCMYLVCVCVCARICVCMCVCVHMHKERDTLSCSVLITYH